MVRHCGFRDQRPEWPIHIFLLECGRVSGAVCDRAAARIWPCTGLPSSWWRGKSNRAVAAGWCRLCGSAASPRRYPVEHRRRAAGERRIAAHFHRSWIFEPFTWMGPQHAQLSRSAACGLVDRSQLAHIQYAAHLSPGWRPDSPSVVVVPIGACPEPHGNNGVGILRNRWIHRICGVAKIRMAGSAGSFHAAELLGRTEARARIVKDCQVAAARWICVPQVQDASAYWKFLEVPAVPAVV